MASDLARDVHLGVTLAFLFGIVLHVVLAFWTLARARTRDAQIFATANGLLAVSLLIQAVEFGLAAGYLRVELATARALLGSQLVANLLVLAIFFQLLSTFAAHEGRPRGGLRVLLTRQLHRYSRLFVPLVYGVVILGGLLYLADAGGLSSALATVRSAIGPTSAYLFGAGLWVLCFVMFPARPGQEHLAVPVAGRALLLTSLGLTVGLVALWHDTRPRLAAEVLMPVLHLHSVPVVVFLALVRYEFAFMDRFVLGAVRAIGWTVVVLAAYWTWHRAVGLLPFVGTIGLSVSRIAILLGAIALAPWVGARVATVAERVLFARRTTRDALHRRFAARLAEGKGLAALIESTCGDIAEALRARGVRVVVGSGTSGSEPVRLQLPLRVGDDTVGRLLLGDRRDLLPYFDGERRLLDGMAPLLAGAISAFRQRRPQPVDEEGVQRALATETPPRPSPARDAAPPAAPARRGWPEPTVTLSTRWQSEVLDAAARAGERDAEAGSRILRVLDRAASHLKADRERQVALEREFEFARDLFALETLRRDNRLEAEIHYPEALAGQAVPRGVALRLMAKAIAAERPASGWPEARVELRATESDGRVEVSVGGEGVGSLRAQFPRRDLERDATT